MLGHHTPPLKSSRGRWVNPFRTNEPIRISLPFLFLSSIAETKISNTFNDMSDVFSYMNAKCYYPPGVKKGFIKGEAFRLLRTNSIIKAVFKQIQN